MSDLLDYITTKKYIVTVHDKLELDDVYQDLENSDRAPPGTEIFRDVKCLDRRPMSRNTVYLLADWEAAQLRLDARIRSVTVHPDELGITAGAYLVTQSSDAWDKSTGIANSMKNWGLLRCSEGQQRTGWGSNGTNTVSGTIQLTQLGKNVDVVICDDDGIVFNHPEYAVNADGTGGSRAIQYNWFQHDPVVKGSAAGTYNYNISSHATHVAGTVAGNTQGWARAANIYNIFYLAGDYSDYNFPYVMDYIREFHRTKSINPATGRKNPTIVNNSWGMSIFPNEWSLSDITAVTYRGTRFTPSGEPVFLGTSGVCTANSSLANLAGLENAGNRITTAGAVPASGGSITSLPLSWISLSNSSAYLQGTVAPSSTYQLVVNTTVANSTIRVKNNVAVGAFAGQTILGTRITITRANDNSIVFDVTDGPYTGVDGASVEATVDQNVILANVDTYTITYITTLTQNQPENTTISFSMLCTITQASGAATAAVVSIGSSLLGAASLASSLTPTVGNNDDGYWTLPLPFSINYLGVSYNTIYPSTNFYQTFGNGSTVWSGVSISNPALPKIMWCAKDNSVQRIYYGTEGVAPNRTFRVRQEGTASVSGTVGSPTMVCEWVFYEAFPDRIDLQTGVNAAKQVGGSFSTAQLNAWGFISGQRIPARVSALDDDIEDLYDEGIIMVGAAGNGRWKHDVPGGIDWNNTFEMGTRYPSSVSQPYYYMRGTSPTANDRLSGGTHDLPAICVGAVDVAQIDQKVTFSDCGPGVDLFAPGTQIISALPSGTPDQRNPSFFIGKFSGTSMASPQACGVLACALETYPSMNQEQAKAYITAVAKAGQLTGTNGGAADGQDLQGAPNLYLFYLKERPTSGNVFPKTNFKPRPAAGAVYPRTKIRRSL